jgi:hypothetical protein
MIWTERLSWSKILSGELPYGWMHDVVHVTNAVIRRVDPFHEVQINMDGFLRPLSSRCLAREPGVRPSIFETMTILK